ncbi:hypothetical protein DB347_06020 [Opitutaceae bacterium EW11]|nr:hypothetical protein DB347_06020 [Opitutaceae bacterium EW11]
MNTITKIVGVLAAAVAASSVFAQTAPENPASEGSSGVLGYRYVEAGFGLVDIRGTSHDQEATGLTVNLPVVANIDVALDYSYNWIKGHGAAHSNTLDVSGIYYLDAGKGLKPFGGVTVGRYWAPHDARYTWATFAGLEYQVTTALSVSGSVGYNSDFKRGNDADYWDGTVTGRYFFTRQIGAFLSASLFEGGDRGLAGGVTYKF